MSDWCCVRSKPAAEVEDDFDDATNKHFPPYFGGYAWTKKNFPNVVRDGDVCVCVGPKSGTTWLMNIVHQIRTLGDPEEFLKHNTHTTPWIDFLRFPGESSTQAIEALMQLDGITNPKYPFRVFKSHYKPLKDGVPFAKAFETEEVVPVRLNPKVKYIVCMRNGLDVLQSFYPFLANHRQEFKDMWGGFPPSFPNFEACFKFFTEDVRGFYHGYCSLWWPYIHDPNVLTLHYSNLKRNLPEELRKIASFVGVNVPDSAWPEIERKVSLEWMKEHEDIFKYDIPLTGFGNIMNDNEGVMIRKGEVGEGKGKLTPEQEAIWDGLNEEYFGKYPGMIEWLNEGGPLPALPA
jgi:hypothetical protein